MKWECWVSYALLAFIVLGCDDPPPPVESPTPDGFETAHAEVVEHAELRDAPEWTIERDPHLSLGTVDGGGADMFGPLAGVTRQADGSLIVAGVQSLELRSFDVNGEHLWTAGGRGDGPGEFRALSAPAVARDSVLVVDLSTGRASLFDDSGEFQRSFQLPAPRSDAGSVRLLQGVLADGTLVITSPLVRPEPETGYRRQAQVLAFCDTAGSACEAVGSFPAVEFVVRANPDGSFGGHSVVMGRETVYAVGADRVAVAPQDEFELYLFRSDGSLERIIRVERAPVPIDGRVRARYVEAGLVGIDDRDERAEVRSRRQEAPFPDAMPVLERVLMDTRGRIWVQEFVPRFEDAEPTWWVFDQSGELMASAHFPSGFVPHQIEEEIVVGVFSDSLGVPYVQVLGIVRE